eukprot:m.77790 g.77790  ORF g.77790 m.77790 type:complete len:241 (-) comp25050_c0_seq1:84-806(-)
MGYGDGTVWQDALAIIWVLALLGIIGWGTNGDRHTFVHIALIPLTLSLPVVCLDFSGGVNCIPTELWLLFGAFVLVEVVHLVVHIRWPEAGHARGPELFNQILLCIWASRLSGVISSEKPHLWYRAGAEGDTTPYNVGSLIFSYAFIVINFAVVYVIYACGSNHNRDDIDFLKYTFRSPGNFYFLIGVTFSSIIAFYVAWGVGYLIAVAVAVFYLSYFVTVEEENVERKERSVASTSAGF